MKMQLNAAARLVAAEEVDAAGFADWSKERQDKYLKEHPSSKYGKATGKPTSKPAPTKTAPAESFGGDFSKKHKIDLGEYEVHESERGRLRVQRSSETGI